MSVLFILAVAVWVGAIVFQSAVVAPAVFGTLDAEGARDFLRTLFPRLFRLGLGCGALMAVNLAAIALGSAWAPGMTVLAALTAAMSAFGAVSLWLVPRINRARDAGAAGAARFASLHRLSVALTLATLLLGTAALVVVGLAADFAAGA